MIMKLHDQENKFFQLNFLKKYFSARMLGLFIIIAIMLTGCVSIGPHQELLESMVEEKIGICNLETAQLNRYFIDRQNYLDPENISVLNWNIHKNKAENWLDDFNSLSKDQDIIIIQEAYLDDQLQDVLSQQDRHWSLNAAFYLDQKPSGVLMASHFKPYYSCGYRVAEPIIRIPKSVLFHYYRVKGFEQSLLVANIHGINFTLGTRAYKEQIEKLQKVAQEHDGPIIIAGDFNNWNDERRAIVDEMLAALSLKSTKFTNSNQKHFFGSVVDHIFYRGLEPLSSVSKIVTSSDHNPIQTQFRMASVEES
jgi:endonuclease/exonuclease/phosphatase (EEP) superfamily protein YafD